MTTFTWDAPPLSAEWTDTSDWSVDGTPVDQFPTPGNDAWIGAGTVELRIPLLYDIGVTLFQPRTGVTIAATDVELGDRTSLVTTAVTDQFGPIVYDVIGSGALDDGVPGGVPPLGEPATFDFAAAPLTIELSAISITNTTATFTNDGAIAGGALFVKADPDTTAATLVNNTTIDVTGPLTIAAGVTLGGAGLVALDGFEASASIGGAVGAGQTIAFVNGPPGNELGGSVFLDNDAQFLGTIALDANHQIVLPGSLVSGPTVFPDGLVTLSDGNTLAVVPVGDANTVKAYALPGGFGTQGETVIYAVETEAACFCAGTRIATARGDVPVEQVRRGDAVRLARGGMAEVVWVGRRDVRCERHPRPREVWPVRIRASAVAPNVPARDLLLSPDHAVAIAGHLIPVRHLTNGATVAQQPTPLARYHHIELARHDLLLAEGLAAETYLDTGNRAAFANGGPAIALHPEFSRRVWAEAGCAPLVERGPALAAARRALLRRAAPLGYRRTRDAALRVLADGRALHAERSPEGWLAHLPAGAREVRLRSRTWVPAEMRPADADTRRLGVAIGRLWLDGREVSLDSFSVSRGWHAPEPAGRWTDGDATLAVDGVRTLAFTLAMAGTYWRHAPAPGGTRQRG